jgi:threonine dehydratase
MKVTLKDVEAAEKIIRKVIHNTPVDQSQTFSKMAGADIFIKRENEQRTGSFKMRGAYNKISTLTTAEKKKGVIAFSAGNHAQGVALSAQLAGVKATIVMPTNAPMVKVEATQGYGAKVIQAGMMVDEAAEHARMLAKRDGFVLVHAYEDEKIIAGQGTLALELFEYADDWDAIIVPIGGGGLISGIATVAKAKNPKCKIYGVQSSQVPSMHTAFKKKNVPKEVTFSPTIADGIAVKRPSQLMYDTFISKLVDDIVCVDEDEISEAIVLLMERTKAVVEGAGAAGIAAVLGKKLKLGKKNCVVLSGGNIDMNLVEKIIDRGLGKRGRIVRMSVIVGDVPGQLNRLTELFSKLKANILQVGHDRFYENVGIMETRIDFTLETNGFDHLKEIKENISKIGIKILT